MADSAQLIVPLTESDPAWALVGGKGWSLSRLICSGLPVPDGFVVSTQAYRAFIDANDLQASIMKQVTDPAAADTTDGAASEIQRLIISAPLPAAIAAAITDAYAALEAQPAVAVRSSATAEDMPGLSFAGQQDSYLNIQGTEALLDAVQRCWASLWTARALSYRDQAGVDHDVVAMGVVIQIMVAAETSGILFTANPTSGDRSQLVVNASYGLGEAIVGGQVTPDTFVIDRESLALHLTTTGSKELMTVSGVLGTETQAVSDSLRGKPSLTHDTLKTLAGLSLKAEELFDGLPQDLEWAVADGHCWLLQSRPITNLPSPPLTDVIWAPPAKGARLVRRQVVENMPEPLTPLFEELYLGKGLDAGLDNLMVTMHLPFNLDEFINRPLFVTVNGYGYCRYEPKLSWRTLRLIPVMLYWYVRWLPPLFKNLIPSWQDEGLPDYLATIKRWQSIQPTAASDEELLSGIRALALADAAYWFYITMMVGAAKITEGMLNRFLSSGAVKGTLTSGMFLRGFPSKTLQAQEDLAAIATRIRADQALTNLVLSEPAGKLVETLARSPAGIRLTAEMNAYFETYGHQVYNLDFAEPTQVENPLPVLNGLQLLLRQPAENSKARQLELTRERELLTQETMSALGPGRCWLLGKLLAWAQKYGPYREAALFYMGAAWPTLRRLALELGKRLVQAGTFTSTSDVFYLTTAELTAASEARAQNIVRPDLSTASTERRSLREARKRLHPPGRVPEDLRFKFGPFDLTRYFEVWETQKRNTRDAHVLVGFAVSPGTVTGRARVILSAENFSDMEPGTILVCPTTTPAWTPLFAQATGLVTDIGAILAHGSIVAREYGIPAVLGTGNGTQRIETGQLIAVDGDKGTVTILDSPQAEALQQGNQT